MARSPHSAMIRRILAGAQGRSESASSLWNHSASSHKFHGPGLKLGGGLHSLLCGIHGWSLLDSIPEIQLIPGSHLQPP